MTKHVAAEIEDVLESVVLGRTAEIGKSTVGLATATYAVLRTSSADPTSMGPWRRAAVCRMAVNRVRLLIEQLSVLEHFANKPLFGNVVESVFD